MSSVCKHQVAAARARNLFDHLDSGQFGAVQARRHAGGACDGKPCKPTGASAHIVALDDLEDLGMFSTATYEQTRLPLDEASTLPSHCYSSRAWYQRELKEMFLPSWTLVGRLDELDAAGSYITLDISWAGPAVVMRGKDGEVRAFANTCRHRGAKVLQEERGLAGKHFTCPYHAWMYDTTGALKHAPGMEDAKGFEAEARGMRLLPLRMEVLCGFIFVTGSDKTAPLAEFLGDLGEHMSEWFGPDGAARDMVCAGREDFEVPCNWKFIMENTCETYHTSKVHAGSLGPMKSWPIGPHEGSWDAVCVPGERSVVPLPEDFEGVAPLPAFTDSTRFVSLFPCLQMNVTWDCMWWMRLLPLGVDRTKVTLGFCFPKATIALPVFDSVFERYRHRWRLAVQEDNAIAENQQESVTGVFHRPGRFNAKEFGVHNFNNWLVDRVLGTSNWDPGARSTGDIVNDNEVLLDKRAGDSELTANMVGTKSGGAKT